MCILDVDRCNQCVGEGLWQRAAGVKIIPWIPLRVTCPEPSLLAQHFPFVATVHRMREARADLGCDHIRYSSDGSVNVSVVPFLFHELAGAPLAFVDYFAVAHLVHAALPPQLDDSPNRGLANRDAVYDSFGNTFVSRMNTDDSVEVPGTMN